MSDGLAQNTVFCLKQDSKGFLWMGTWHGLSRFDGYQFVNFVKDFRDPNSISDNKINSIIETRSGEIWLGTRNGLDYYDQETNQFKAYYFANDDGELGDSYVQVVFEDHKGTLWVGTDKNGLNRFDRQTGKFHAYKNDPSNDTSLSNNSVSGIVEDAGGFLWIATADGLNRFDPLTERFVRFGARDDEKGLSNSNIRSLTLDSAGMIWLATQRGLNKLDPAISKFTKYLADTSSSGKLSSNNVFSVFQAKNGTIWVGTESGLDRLSPDGNVFENYKYDPGDIESLTEGFVYSITEDRSGQLWVGTSVGGLSKFNQRGTRFEKYRHVASDPSTIGDEDVYALLEDKQKGLWVGTVKGLYYRSRPEGGFENFRGIREYTRALYETRDGVIWIGTTARLRSYDPRTGVVTDFQYDPNKPNEVGFMMIYEDHDGKMWLAASNDELCTFDRSTGKFQKFRNGPNRAGMTSVNKILAILQDRLGQMWIGTRGGVYQFDPATENFRAYKNNESDPDSISSSPVGAIYEDKSGTLWFGTSGGGLNRFDRNTEKFEHFTVREGMPIDNVYEILEDDIGHLWLTTDRGLARFNVEKRQFRTFDVNDGLTYDEFNDKAAFKNSDGEIYVGGSNGFVKFDPRMMVDSVGTPPVYVTDIRILEQPLNNGQNVVQMKHLDLSWRDYVVSFDFTALDSTDPKKLQYQWKLEGFDPDWINGGTRRTATYSNLPGGDYVLKAKATNVDGVWGDEFVLLNIHVQPPFYLTGWFITLVVIAAAALIWLAYRYRISQMRAISEAQTKFTHQLITSQEAERKRIAAELHDGLGQSLVIIKNRAMLGLSKGDDKDRVVRELGSISESASQALDEVREITNDLRPQLLDRLGLTKAIGAMLKKYAGVIDVKSEIDAIDGLFAEGDEISIYRIIQESLNNVIKHSNASNAEVKVKHLEKRVRIEITDNGKGFDPQSLPAEKRSFGLTGLRERAQLLGGELVIDSQIGSGTKISVTFQTGG